MARDPRLSTADLLARLSGKASATHTHPVEDIAGLDDLGNHSHAPAELSGLPKGGWWNPSGSGYNKGYFNADDEHPISNPATGSEVLALQNRLKDTRAVLRALILDLKAIGILGD